MGKISRPGKAFIGTDLAPPEERRAFQAPNGTNPSAAEMTRNENQGGDRRTEGARSGAQTQTRRICDVEVKKEMVELHGFQRFSRGAALRHRFG
jgi:hypothetical protein